MENKPFFSVIMPCYNSESYVRNAINSLLNQTFYDWELIAINDGSTDHTLEILNSYTSIDKRIKVFTKPNGGYATAVNFGLDYVSGKYFLLMGSDDCLSVNLFEETYNNVAKTMPDMVGFRTVKFMDGKNVGLDACTSFSELVYEENTTINQFEMRHPEHVKIFSNRDTSKFYKTALLGDLRYFGKFGYDADGIFSILFSHKAKSFLSVPVDGYCWTLRKDSVSGRKTSIEVDLDRLNNWCRFYKYLENVYNTEFTEFEKKYINIYLNIVYSLCHRIRITNKSALKEMFKSIRLLRYLIEKYNIHPNSKKAILQRVLLLRFTKIYILTYKIKTFLHKK